MRRLWHRQIWIVTLFSLVFLILIGRLAYIQLLGTESYSKHQINLVKKSVQQRQQQFVLHSGRGEITDRFGITLTGKTTYVLALFPLLQKHNVDELHMEQLEKVLSVPRLELQNMLENVREPKIAKLADEAFYLTEEQANQINDLAIPGILGLPYEQRYDTQHLPAQHMIGYIGENEEYLKEHYPQELAQGTLKENSIIGIMGLEKTFQPFLQGLGPVALSYYVDGRGNPIPGLGLKYTEPDNPFYPLMIKTTLDLGLQETVEQLMDQKGLEEGTVVVQDIATAEILAISSRPQFLEQMDHPEAWENKALKRYPPGSVFKIVVAAAALESGRTTLERRFHCNGELTGSHFHCWKTEGHGTLSFAEGFAQSCNIVFGQLAQELGAEKIEAYAKQLGLIQPNGWAEQALFHLQPFQQLDGEEWGQVFAPNRTGIEKNDRQFLLQTGIGQLDVQVSPLAVANMLTTIAKGGKHAQVKIVNDILYQTGASFYHFPAHKSAERRISPYTAFQLQHLMALVVDQGTAQAIKNKPWAAGGKTGTAQRMIQQPQGRVKELNHYWFAGYYPRHKPKYSVVVLHLNQEPNHKNSAIDVFAEIIDWLAEHRDNKK